MSEERIEWTVHPFRDRPRLGVLVLAVILAMSAAAYFWTRLWFWAVFSFLVLFLSLEPFYFPTRFILEPEKVTVIRRFSRSEREWAAFKRCVVEAGAVILSPFRKASWLEEYRAVRLRFLRDNREAVLAYLRARLGPDTEWITPSNRKKDATAA